MSVNRQALVREPIPIRPNSSRGEYIDHPFLVGRGGLGTYEKAYSWVTESEGFEFVSVPSGRALGGGEGKDLLATVSSLMLSKTSDASVSFSKVSRRFSNVLVRIVSGLFPVKVCGSRVTRDIKGYGTCPPQKHIPRRDSSIRRGLDRRILPDSPTTRLFYRPHTERSGGAQ